MADWRMHPEEGDLLRYCDGELRAKEAARVAQHLEACWDCRTHADDLKQTIAEYVRYRRDVWEPALPQPPQPWKNLRSEFARMGQPSAGAGWRRIFQRRVVWLVACTLTAGTGIFFYATKQPPLPPVVVLSPPAAPTLPVIPHVVAPHQAAAPPGPEDELRVIAALDRIDADLGDPIEISRTSDRIVVTCIALDARRMLDVRAALAGLPRVSVELAPKPNTTAAGSPLEVVGEPHASTNKGIARQFNTPADYEKFVDGLLKSSEAMMARAHALRRLATRFPAVTEAPMTSTSKALLAAMREHHETVLARQVSLLAHAVQPYLGPAPRSPAASPAQEVWQQRSLRLFADAEQVDRLLGAVFAGSQGAAQDDATPAALAAALAKLESDVAR